jgi:excisionase family DNA binding protein
MMNTREVAEYLRIKERKIYDLVRAKRIPCSRVTGKWLFPKQLIDLWVAQKTDYADAVPKREPPPAVVAGSHDPLLDCSLDGLKRLVEGACTVAGMHVHDAETGDFNLPLIKETLRLDDIVAIEWAWREQGLVTAAGNPLGLRGLADLRERKARVIQRQHESGSQILLVHLLSETGIRLADLQRLPKPALTENDLGLAIVEGKADAGLAVRAVAAQYRLEFVPLTRERFDLVMRRRDYFEPPMQALLAFAREPAFAARAADLGGYDIGALGRVVWNG